MVTAKSWAENQRAHRIDNQNKYHIKQCRQTKFC